MLTEFLKLEVSPLINMPSVCDGRRLISIIVIALWFRAVCHALGEILLLVFDGACGRF